MPIVLITNPKGGCGKSTAATNLAGYFAWRGHPTMLGDLDRQQSALAWLGIRPATLPHIRSWDRSDEKVARPPKCVTHVVLDTPAGLRGHALRDVMKLSDRVIVPVQPSIFDIYATQAFLTKLADRICSMVRPASASSACASTRARERPISCSALSRILACRCLVSCATRRTTFSWPRTG
jgi:chromosome partitioning protein